MSSIPPSPVGYERSPVPGADMDDLDQDALREHLRRRAAELLDSRTTEELAKDLGLAANAGGRSVPTVAGVLLMGKRPQLGRPEWGVAAVRIRGVHMSDPVASRLDVEGRLCRLVDDTLSFLGDHSRSVANLVDPADSEPEYPLTAVREALLNALIHRDYRLTGRVSLRIFDDRVEVWNPGGMPVQLSLEHMAQHGGVSFPRNPILAAAARTMGLIDQIGRGLPCIRRAMADVVRNPVHFGSSKSDFLVVLPSRLGVPHDNAADN